MKNFHYSIPTDIYFGKGQIDKLPRAIKPYGTKVLLVYGGGTIKRTGLYDEVIKVLNHGGISQVELNGVEPNPRITTVRKGVDLCRNNDVEAIVAIGGGSTIDCAKVIGAAYHYDGDPWELVTNPSKITKVLPIFAVLTLSATGSEMDPYAVISNMDTNEKLGTAHEGMKPKASILDPQYTYTVSPYQTAAGTADIMSHIFEEYFSNVKEAYLQDRMAEALLKTCIKYGKIATKEPNNYEARANLMWASSLAINGLLGYGKDNGWSVHPMEHELSAFYDITHGVGLAILTPHWMKYVLGDETLDKFVEYGINVWNIDRDLSSYDIANKAVEKTKEYFVDLGIPERLRDVGIEESKLQLMAKQATRFGKVGTFKPLDDNDVLNIFKAAF